MKTTTIICANCGSAFDREVREIKRSQKIGRKNYCSRTCSGKKNHTHLDPYKGQGEIWKHSGKKDEFTGLRIHISKAKRREKRIDISVKDLFDIWNLQKGICVYSKVALLHPVSKGKNNPVYTASLDRIDSSIGYIKNNIQFVSIAVNYMKNTMTDSEVKNFINILKQQK